MICGEQILDVNVFYFRQAVIERFGFGFSNTLKFLFGNLIDQIRNGNEFTCQITSQTFMDVDVNHSLVSNQIVAGYFRQDIIFHEFRHRYLCFSFWALQPSRG